ncbi:MAG: hypothetical protein AB7I25_12735 [Vicinamibacterales bacterium]
MAHQTAPSRVLIAVACAALLALGISLVPETMRAADRVPTATLTGAAMVSLPGTVDSNSPVLRDMVRGQLRLFVMTSASGQPAVSSGTGLTRMATPQPVRFTAHPGDGVWMESVVQDEGGAWYGFYHQERPVAGCGRPGMVRPRVGAARSTTRGLTWEDLGPVIEAPPGSDVCDSPNQYFVGGVGDLSAILDEDKQYLYLFFSQYGRVAAAQGVGVARMPWAARDRPQGELDAWVQEAWVPLARLDDASGSSGEPAWRFRSATPLVRPARPWHDRDRVDDGFWGPAVHWNTAVGQYVMLLNRTADNAFSQEGVYVSFARSLDTPSLWTAPTRLLKGGTWYPQVVGDDPRTGTDTRAGATARFFMGGVSNHIIWFRYQ